MKWTFGAGLTVAINGPLGTTIINDSGNLASAASNRNILYLLYCGKNENGNYEVSYTIKQA
jgi:tetrahydromethanopterin S-methyltransferase subunit A